MKKWILIFLIALIFSSCQKSKPKDQLIPKEAKAIEAPKTEVVSLPQETIKVFNLYRDKKSPDNHFIPSGWMGDYQDIAFNDVHLDNPHSGTTCIKISYSNKATSGARWAGIYWQQPANNWGGVEAAGFDLKGYKKLIFWARGENGTERIEEFKFGGISGNYSDSDTGGIGPVILSKDWQQFTIDLTGKDLSYIIGGFCWATNLDVNPDGATFYLDDIYYLKD